MTKKLFKYIIIIFILLILCYSIYIKFFSKKLIVQPFGIGMLLVGSGSMEPEFYPGDIVITKHKNKTDINLNDIVTFRNKDGVIITHRIIEETLQGYITKGDNNNVEDAEMITVNNIIGEVKFSIPKVGYIIDFLSKPMVIATEMILLAGFIFFYYKD